MNVEIGSEAAKFPGKEYINGIAVAVKEPSRHRVVISARQPMYLATQFHTRFLESILSPIAGLKFSTRISACHFSDEDNFCLDS
jgi:hypothetical protein